MSYKYSKGSLPGHMGESIADPGARSHVGVDTVYADKSKDVKSADSTAAAYIKGGGNGKGGEFSDSQYGVASNLVDKADALRKQNNSNTIKRTQVSDLLSLATQKPDATRTK